MTRNSSSDFKRKRFFPAFCNVCFRTRIEDSFIYVILPLTFQMTNYIKMNGSCPLKYS